MSGVAEVLERVPGSCGETVVRRRGADLEIVVNGAFLMSTANGASSRALVSAALPYLKGGRLEVFVGGLGLGYALDEALACPRVAGVVVAELEPTIVRWFREYGEERAVRAAEGGRDGRVRLEIADATALLAARPAAFDLVALDTDNGPDWLVREASRSSGRQTAAAGSRSGWRRSSRARCPWPPATSCKIASMSALCTWGFGKADAAR